MSASMRDPSLAQPPHEGWATRSLGPEMWATVAIVTMWIAVLFVGVYGGDLTFHGVDSSVTTIPSVIGVALFAAIATGSVAKRTFGRRSS